MEMKCIGFGDKENKCDNFVSVKYQSTYWCDTCEENRRKTITGQLNSLLKSFDKNKS